MLWWMTVDVCKKHSIWLSSDQEVQKWQEEQDQKRLEKLLNESWSSSSRTSSTARKVRARRRTLEKAGTGSDQQWQEQGWYDVRGNYHETCASRREEKEAS